MIEEKDMKETIRMMKQCRALALAGFIGAGLFMPAGTALAAGPGEVSSQTAASGGPGQPAAAQGGTGTPPAANNTNSGTSTNPNAWKKVNGAYQMPDGSAISNVRARGIDVSRWQGDINWSQVAADDVSFVMLGTRSKGAVDPYFHKNIQQASAAGIKVGVYIYSLAMTPEMAVQEADFILNLIHDYPVSFPVAFDMEDSTQGTLSKEELAAIANAFCGRISSAGYYPMIYANDNWLANKLDMNQMNYPVWVARYSARPAYANPVMWQATSTGAVNGIGGNVDIDFQFKDFSEVIPANTWRTINSQRYYYQNYVKQKNNWIQDGNDWYYMDGEGLSSKGWITLSGKRYYLDESTGRMMTGWKSDAGKWYYMGSSGAAAKGWVKDKDAWYYTNDEGVMQTGWLDEGGRRYFLENSGAMAKGWTNQNGKWYYLDGTGVLSKGWIQDAGIWYYSNGEGVMQTGWLDEGGSRYYLRGSGAMAKGWREMDGAWYYFEDDGHMARGMVDMGGLHYYMDPSTGRMAKDTAVDVNGTSYQADGNGVLSQAAQDAAAGAAEPGAGTEGQTGTAQAPSATQGNGVSQDAPSAQAPQASRPDGVNGGPGTVIVSQ